MAFINCPECNQNISEKAKVCVHCGYPVVEEKPVKFPCYQLTKTENEKHPLALLLKITAGLTLVGSLIAGIALDVEEYTFGYTLLFGVIGGFSAFITWQFSDLVGKIQNTHEMLSTLTIGEKNETSENSGYKLSSIAKNAREDRIKCRNCGTMNFKGKTHCQACARPLS